MTRKTHIAIGTVACIPFITSPLGLIGLLGSIAPDYDIKLNIILHRTFTHSLIFLMFSSLIISIFSKEVSLIWFISYSSHLILDSLTVSGIPLFWGIKNKKYGLKLFHTGFVFDNLLFIIGLGCLLISIGNMILNLF